MKYKIRSVVFYVFGLVLLCPIAIASEPQSKTDQSQPEIDLFMNSFKKFINDDGDILQNYIELTDIFADLKKAETNSDSYFFILSQIGAIMGDYQPAEEYQRQRASRTNSNDLCKIENFRPIAALDALQQQLNIHQIVLINESRHLAKTRSFIYQLLPRLKKAGFEYLAIEALFPLEKDDVLSGIDKILADQLLVSRGYPLDDFIAGFYIREPVFAEIIGLAIELD